MKHDVYRLKLIHSKEPQGETSQETQDQLFSSHILFDSAIQACYEQ